jgi:hypothetical protein
MKNREFTNKTEGMYKGEGQRQDLYKAGACIQ